MRIRILGISLLVIGAFVYDMPAEAAVVDSQLDASAQATQPPLTDYWTSISTHLLVPNFVAAGYIPSRNLSFSGVRFRINTSGGGNYHCPEGVLIEYFGTSTPAMWDRGVTRAGLVVATTTPDANGNCDYRTTDNWGNITPVSVSPLSYYIFFMGVHTSSASGLDNWVSMSGKPFASSTPVSFFGYRPATSNYYVWGTSGLDAPYFELFDTAPPPPTSPPDPCVATHTCTSNVLFLPGIEGSRLYDTESGETRLWESDDSGAQQIAMNPDGTSWRRDVYTKDVLNTISVSGFTIRIYQPFIDAMNVLKSGGTINDWEAIPYDWRLQLDQILSSGNKMGQNISYLTATSSPYIIQELRRLAATSKTGKVTIVAHSNGGLVAKALTEKLGSEAATLIDKIIFVAVPQIGAADAVEGILSGKDESVPSHLSPATERYISQNLFTTYNLLPSTNYFTQIDDPVISFDPVTMQDWIVKYGTGAVHSTDRLSAFMLDSSHSTMPTPADIDLDTPTHTNGALFDVATNLHAGLDVWKSPLGIQLFEIAGWGNETLSGITYKRERQDVCIAIAVNGNCAAIRSLPTKLTFSPNHVIDGDGTVVEPSALWSNGTTTKYWLNLNAYNAVNDLIQGVPGAGQLLFTDHGRLFKVNELNQLVTNIIENGTSAHLPDKYITIVAPVSGVTNRLHFTLHSPLTLGFTDTNNNYTGATATTTVFDIPGVQYERYGDVQWLSVPKNMAGTVVMRGTGTGSFALDVEEQDGNTVVATTTFAAIPSATSTLATLIIDPAIDSTASGTLVVDYSGNGTADTVYHAIQGAMVFPDLTPPEAVIGFSTTTKRIEITGMDDTSSTTVTTTATSTTVTDEAGNWLFIGSAEPQHPRHENEPKELPVSWLSSHENQDGHVQSHESSTTHADSGIVTRTIYSLSYSTGTTTDTTAILRYFWNIDRKGEYTTFVSSIKIENSHLVAIYIPHLSKTYIVSAPLKDSDDLFTHLAELLRHKHLKTYNGLYIPSIQTEKGKLIIR